MSAKVAVVVFPGTNSEDETLQLLRDCGAAADLVHWSRARDLANYDAFVLPGGFAYEDRVRAGAIPAHDPVMDYVIAGAQAGKLVLGICNGAQILLEAGLVPGTGEVRRPTAAFTHNAQQQFVCKHVYVKLSVDPSRSPITAGLRPGEVIPAWAAHGQGRLAAGAPELDAIRDGGHLAFVYAREDGSTESATPNGSALGCAGLLNRQGNVLAIMPHPERDGWTFNHPRRARQAVLRRAQDDGDRSDNDDGGRVDVLSPSGGAVLFRSFVKALAA